MTETEPTCGVCDDELVEETRALQTWTVKTSSVRGGAPVETERTGWKLAYEFACGSTVTRPPGEDRWAVVKICPNAHRIALELKRRVSELEVKLAAEICAVPVRFDVAQPAVRTPTG